MRPNRPVLSAAAAALAFSLLTACGSSSGGADTGATTSAAASAALSGVTATGAVDLKTAPKVTFASKPVSTATVEQKVLTPGAGDAATKADTVGVKVQIFNGTSGKMLDDGFTEGRAVENYRLGRADLLPGFTEGLIGVKKDSRVVFTIPPEKGFGAAGNEQLGVAPTDTIVVVADVADVRTGLTQIDGTMTPSPAGLPTVTFPNGPTKAPTVTVPKTAAPTTLKEATLIEGKGAVVKSGQTLVAQYHGLLWKDGSVFDSSWERGSAADFPIGVGQVIPGWDKALVGKKIGSRVLLVIPPAEGYGTAGSPPKIAGTDTLVFVVDILDAY
ncbi:MAG: FKBP-type peptidyl-prolyl cis-trans isomerase [Terracoccus sp.]